MSENEALRRVFMMFVGRFSGRQAELLIQRYGLRMSLRSIGRGYGVSRQAIHDSLSKIQRRDAAAVRIISTAGYLWWRSRVQRLWEP